MKVVGARFGDGVNICGRLTAEFRRIDGFFDFEFL